MIKYADYPKDYKVRATGWIQDAADFENLHRFVSIFSGNSSYKKELFSKIENYVPSSEMQSRFFDLLSQNPISLPYNAIVGSAPQGSRKANTVCNGIGQAALKGQKRPFQGDWPTDNFLRWAESLQLIAYSPYTGGYEITDVGEKYVNCNDFLSQKTILVRQLMMYPPAIRILELLAEKPCNKFMLGENLGFIGEKGFTYITEELFVEKYFAVPRNEGEKLKRDFEGSADKYARQICSWLKKLDLVKEYQFTYTKGSKVLKLKGYEITVDGKDFIRKAKTSKKHVPFGMLSMENRNKETHCKRRALILKSILRENKTIEQIYEALKAEGINTSKIEISDDIKSLVNIGLDIKFHAECFSLSEEIVGLVIPNRITVEVETEIEKLKSELRKNILNLDHDLLNLIEYSYSKKSARFFEVYVAKVYRQINNSTFLLGGPSKPDVVSSFNEFSLIIDAKAYRDGFNMPVNERDKMVRYIEEYKKITGSWVEDLKEKDYYRHKFAYQFVSSAFKNAGTKLADIYERTGVAGSAITGENLLYLTDKILSGTEISFEVFSKNQEIICSK